MMELLYEDYRYLSSGYEADVFFSKEKNTIVKVHKTAQVNDGNDDFVMDIDLYNQEYDILNFLEGKALLAPSQPRLVTNLGKLMLEMEYIESDGSTCSIDEKICYLKKLHALPVSGVVASISRGSTTTFDEYIINRLMDRASKIYSPSLDPIAKIYRELLSCLNSRCAGDSLLHLDFRNENILCKNSRIVGVIDWCNSLVGDPLMDIARLISFEENLSIIDKYLTRKPNKNELGRIYIYLIDVYLMLTLFYKNDCSENSNLYRSKLENAIGCFNELS
ncbi:APH domain-containing protein [Vibrio chagasii]|uniref:aminoglycoside phosphotransferase family protein n=1 Tax=Vibrio TaxID=662 RepID=UPI001493D722|nr:aminoglycoside phosphotransferase family protein [Vibrio sp. T3Y01]CAH6812221.1 APH domain-containing protein [Vibrio chagasii]CAK2519906.1 Aminoglycoside phosphotransferase family protein [Vibrio crassostreae]NOI97457.1 aminoglycoside phosphotransferase family protein [Vibrio sp. T3Y01]CAH6838053.1 APH domain-containing protein [Vibrio chagasii]CAH6846663.1 APH domain-containing protein [Vibrio chagasii]